MNFLRKMLAEPDSENFDINDPAITVFRRGLIRRKPFLRAIYSEWYSLILSNMPAGEDKVVELGSGAGFLQGLAPDLITSEVFVLPGLNIALDGRHLPFRTGILRAIVLIDVLHHIADPRSFFAEAVRTLRPGGRIIMVEPWVTRWSRFVYGRLHHEPFRPESEDWEFPSDGPLSGANGALPWIIFERDREIFTSTYPTLCVTKLRVLMPFRYLLSGGVSMRAVVPSWSFQAFHLLENALGALMPVLGMFAFIVVERRSVA